MGRHLSYFLNIDIPYITQRIITITIILVLYDGYTIQEIYRQVIDLHIDNFIGLTGLKSAILAYLCNIRW